MWQVQRQIGDRVRQGDLLALVDAAEVGQAKGEFLQAMAQVRLREAAYEQVNRDIMQKYLPAVPISSSPPALVVAENVQGLIPSPLTDERFFTVTVN